MKTSKTFIEFRVPNERIKLVNPTDDTIIFNIYSSTPSAFSVSPTCGRMDPNKEFEFCVELISSDDPRKIYEDLHEKNQFCFEWVEIPKHTLMAECLNHNLNLIHDGTAIKSLCEYFGLPINEDVMMTVVQKTYIEARFSTAMVWNERPRSYPRTNKIPQPIKAISTTAACLRIDIDGDVLSYYHTLRNGASVPLQLANISPNHIILYKWLIASPLSGNKDRYYVNPHSGMIDSNTVASITFAINAVSGPVTEGKKHSEKFLLRWIEVERGTVIGNWIEGELTVNGVDRARWIDMIRERWSNQVKIHEWKMHTIFEEGVVTEQKQKLPILSNRSSLRCLLGSSIGLYQWNVKY